MNSLLIIDDDVTLLARLGAQLEEAGYLVAKSSDLMHGEQLFAETRPDLVLLEVRIGHDGGWELLPRLAADVPVMVLSGAAHEEDVVRALEAGAIDHIAKPYRTSELLARLRARLGNPLPVALADPAMSAQAVGGATPPPMSMVSHEMLAEPSAKAIPNHERGDAKVFMAEAEELAMLRTRQLAHGKATITPLPDFGDQQGLGSQMRAERMRRHMTLVQVENELKIRMAYLQAMEDEKFTLLPRGPAALHMAKSYAEHLDLDASSMLEELRTQGYGEVLVPLTALGGRPLPRSLPRWLVLTLAISLALLIGLGAIMLFDPEFFVRLPEFLMQLWMQVQAYLFS
ncbi:MAG: response regulator [Candidatus Viridilinea halotolerans]|uniref:Response regulator n=1 Tax=Candidatus Viridilinea halotolerans TaxID=2491704 RepID=A0A426U0S5_9CHLR|nr:MAG: response regulator [Candidatus Viridilinea halotolerans]